LRITIISIRDRKPGFLLPKAASACQALSGWNRGKRFSAAAMSSIVGMQVAACHGQADDTGLAIEEHYTDTGGVTDHVFGLCHLSPAA
jgi:Tn3 transposase DDE domain